MAPQEIIIQLNSKRKVFKINPLRYDEFMSLIEYYGYDYCLENNIFIYSDTRIFNIIDLNLSFETTPEPQIDEALIA